MEPGTGLLCEIRGEVGVMTLNRPEVLNALNMSMIVAMHRQLRDWAANEQVRVVVVKGAGSRAFCAGGDVRAVFDARGNDAFMDRIYRVEYQLDDYISRYPKPYIALMSGITMGGGCGISIHGRHRVVTESSVIAMPEVAIGLFPDIAASHFLARCPGATGLYLGLTGARIGGGDAIYLGLADYLLGSAGFERFLALLANGCIDNVTLERLAVPPQVGEVERLRQEIDACFGRESVREIVQAVKRHGSEWSAEAARAMDAASPTSLEITYRAIKQGRGKSIRDCLIDDFRIAQRLMKNNDYFEGVRALIIDKDRKPKWNPPSLAEVRPETIERYFAPLQSGDLTFPVAFEGQQSLQPRVN